MKIRPVAVKMGIFIFFIFGLTALIYYGFVYNKGDSIETFKRLDVNMNPEKEITHITSGIIKSSTLIAVRFKEEQISAKDLNKIIENNGIFVFEPGITGRVFWEDRRTVVFKPDNPLLERNKYIGTINLKALFPQIENVQPERKVFEFETLGQEIVSLEGDFQLLNRDDDSKLVFRGRLELVEKYDLDRVRKALKFLEGGREYDLTVKSNDGLIYNLESEIIIRNDREKVFTLSVKKDDLNLSEDFEQKYTLSSRGELRVSRIEEERDGDLSSIRIIFSDELEQGINYSGFVNLEPSVNFRTEVEGKVLRLKGRFAAGQKFNLKLLSGIRSRLGKELKTSKDFELEIKISDINPGLEFVNSGVFLTTAKSKKIAFRTMNLERVQLKVKKVEEADLIKFFEEKSFQARNDSFDEYNRYGFKRVGQVMDSKILEIGREKNKWIQSEIDLSRVIEEEESALYILQLEYSEDDALYFPEEWDHWRIRNYVWNNGRKIKHLILSDIGITAKRSTGETHVFVTDVLKAEPLSEAMVLLKDGENRVLETAYTDEYGMCLLKEKGEYIEVRKRYQYAILKFKESRLDYSLFDVGGIDSAGGIKAFTYFDRGVYRPGDRVNLSLIVRSKNNTFPENHPVTLKVYNPKNKLMVETTKREALDGFYTFSFTTDEKALTGNWRAELKIGDSSFSKVVRIEEVVPYRIKVEIESNKKGLTVSDSSVDFSIISHYLFGTPATGLESNATLKVEPYEVSFNRFKKFTFNNETINFKPVESNEFINKLDDEGKVRISWPLPEISQVPSAVRVRIDARVLEKGGRPVPRGDIIPIQVYNRYVGISKLENDRLQMGNRAKFNIILVSEDGELIADKQLKYRIYRLRKYWWWEFDDRVSFRRHYKTDTYTEVVKEGTITSAEGPVSLEYNLNDYGEMLIEVEDPVGGHSAGYFFRSYWWGDGEATGSADVVNIKIDKEKYLPGDTARVLVKTPEKGLALVTVEKGDEILYKEWQEIKSNNMEYEIPVTAEFVPTAYVSVSVFQPYQETENDLPIRMYGIIPLMVERKDSTLKFTIDTPESVKPGEEFEVIINSNNRAQYTVAVVDEGLLTITDFKTPDPWDYFFQKERLITRTFDTFSDIIGLNWGYIYHIFSVGGDSDQMDRYRNQQLQSTSKRRFEPVALFKGPIQTNEDGEARVNFKMPGGYIGGVRVMVIGAKGGRYGSMAKGITVKSPLMVMPTLPRVLRPDDKIEVPVTVFAMEDNLGEVKLKMEFQGPVQARGETEKVLHFTGKETRDIYFELEAEEEIGTAEIKITASTPEHQAEKTVNLAVKASNPYIYLADEKIVESGEEVKLKIPVEGIKNSSSARISLARRKNLKLDHRIKWLIRYPYGCIEQTTSSVFPQLYLKELFNLSEERIKEIDENINAAIERLRTFQLADGGFSYWPNGNKSDLWGSNYAGHFLLEARNKGYHVPEDMLKRWINFQQDKSKDNSEDYLTRAYRLYLLAMANNETLSAMNYLRESKLDKMNTPAKYYLAGAYKLLGYEKIARNLIKPLETEVEEYQETGRTYGSALRDKAIMLEVTTIFEDYDRGLPLYNEIAEKLSSEEWYSTQTAAYSLLALSKYITADAKQDKVLKGRIVLPDREEVEFGIDKTVTSIPLTGCFDKEIKIINESDRPIFASMEWEGIPLRDEIRDEEKNLLLTVQWRDEEGKEIDPGELKQGTSFWGIFQVWKEYSGDISEAALVQILPAGWEIENLRLQEGQLPNWMQDLNLNQEEYLDIRDDRIMWFFDHESYYGSYDFAVKLNTVTVGEFYLPPTVVEAMYNNKFKASRSGRKVRVSRR